MLVPVVQSQVRSSFFRTKDGKFAVSYRPSLMTQSVMPTFAPVPAATMRSGSTAPAPFVEVARPKPASKDAPIRAGGKALGRAWLDEDLKALADAYLDGAEDGDLAQRFNRSRGQVRELRQAFECARGNRVEDQISPIAATWVARWRKALTQ